MQCLAVLGAALALTATGCSDFLLNSTAPVLVSGRTMDFTVDLRGVAEVVPRGSVMNEPLARGCPECPDFAWQTTYGFVGLNMYGANLASDGLNEKGLSAAWLWLDATEYPLANASDPRPIVTSLISYILGNYATVDDVKAGLPHVQVAELDPRLLSALAHIDGDTRYTLHVAVHDAAGKSLVIEFLDQALHMYDNPRGIMTNDPPLVVQWRLLADATDAVPQGYGSVERFQRLALWNRLANRHFLANASYSEATDEQAAVANAVRFLGTVQIPVAQADGGATEFSLVRDHTHRKLYFASTQNQNLRVIDLDRIDFAAPRRHALPVTYGAWYQDVTDALVASTATSNDVPPRSKLQALVDHTATHLDEDHRLAHPVVGMLVGVALGAGVVIGMAIVRQHRRSGYANVV